MSKFRDFEKYEVFENGHIWSYKTKRFLKPTTMKNGYQLVHLSDNEGKIKTYYVHRVVYETFSGEPIQECMQCNHIDENKENNARSNLNLMTPKQNTNWGSGIARRTKKISKQVAAYKDGKLVMTFQSTMEAGRNGFCQVSVARCCRGEKKTHRGYTWKYINEKRD